MTELINGNKREELEKEILRRGEQIKKSEDRYRALFDNMIDGFALHKMELDDSGNPVDYTFLEVNSAFETLTGLKREDIIERKISEIYPEIQKESSDWIEKFGHVALQGGEIQFEMFSPPISKWFSIRSYCPEKGYFAAIFEDITHRKHAIEALRESEERHRTLFETMAQGVVYQAADGKIISANPAAERILGLTLDEMLGRTSKDPRWKAVREDGSDFEGKDHPSMVALRTGKEVRNVIMGVFNPKKTDFNWININAIPQFGERDKTPHQVYTTFDDITERKNAEDALRKSEIRFRSLIEQTTDSVFCYEYDPPISTNLPIKEQMESLYRGELIECNNVCARSYGATKAEEVIGRKLTELFGTSPGSLDEFFRTFIQNGYRTVDKEGIELLPDGTKRYYINNGHAVLESDNLVRIWGTFRDITDHKIAKEALLESEKRYRTLFEVSPASITLVDKSGIIIDCNISTEKLIGYSKEEIIGKPFDKLMTLDSNDLPKLKEKYMTLLKGEDVESYELRIIKKNGERRWISIINSLLMKDEKVVGFQIISNDITEKKKAEERLKTLSSAVEQSTSSIAILDKEGKVEYANPKLYELYEISPDDVIGQHWQSFVSKYSTLREKIDEIRETVLKRGELWSGEVSDKSKLGEEVWRMASIYPIKDDKGEITYIIYSSEDITERKRGEQQTIIQRDLGQSLSAMTNLEEAMSVCVETAINASGMDSGGVYLVNKNTGDLDLFYAKGLSPEFVRAASHYGANSSNAQLVMSGKPTYVLYPEGELSPDVKSIPEGLLALAVIPLIHENKVIGCFNIASHTQSEISIPARNTLESIAAQVGSSIARLQAEEALRISEDRYRTISELISDFVYSIRVEPDGTNISEWSTETLERIIGMSHAELLEHGGWKNVIHPEDLPIVVQRQQNLAQGKSEVSEYRVINKDGEVRWVRDYGHPVFDEKEGRVVRILGAAQDITERKRAEEALQATKERLQYLVSSNPAVIYTSKTSGDFGATFVSENVTTLLGYEPREFIEDSGFWANHIHPEDAPCVLADLSHLLEHGHHIHEYRFLHKDGTYHWMCDELKLVKDAKGKPLEIIGYWIDITERKKAEEAVRESEEKYRTLFSSSPEAIVLIGLDGTILDCNDFAEKIGGVKKDELIGKSFMELDLFEEDDISTLMDNFHKVLKEDISGPLEFDIKIAKEKKCIEVFPAFLKKENEVYALQLIIRDITERKEANEALLESEEKYRSLVEEISDVIFSVDQNGTITYMSPAVEALTGYSTSEIVGKSFFEFMHKEDFAKAKEGFAQSISGHAHPNEYRGYHKSGDIFWIRTYSQPIYEDGKVIGARGILSDITEKKLAEEELKNSEEKYRSLVEKAGEGIARTDIEGRFTYVNDTLCEMLGYAREEFIGKEFIEFIHPEDKGKILELFMAGLKDPAMEGTDFEFRVIHKNGQIVHFYSKPTVLWLGNEIAGFNAIVTDITERKLAEQALRESQEKYRDLVENINDVIYTVNKQGKVTYISPVMEGSKSGFTVEEILGTHFNENVHPEDLDRVNKLGESIMSGNLGAIEYRTITKPGEVLWVRDSCRPIIKEGNVEGFQGVLRDITEYKEAEQKLKESEEKFRELAELLPQTIFELDLNGNLTYSNQHGYESTGYVQADFDSGLNVFELIHPENHENLKENISMILKGEKLGASEYKLMRKDKTSFPVLVYSRPIIHEGKSEGLRGIVVDITDRKKGEEELKHSLKERELLFRELKHRVKNNLQLLSSMVSMQSMQTENESILKKLQEVQSVIETMALIYSRAYEGSRISGLNLKSFIEELIADLMKFKTREDMKVNYQVEGEDIRLTTDQAIPIALIANELIFNSLKHAFVGRNEGLISISLKELDKSISMAIRDDGIGIGPGIEIDKPGTLGLKIVKNLTEQLQGNMEIINKNGTEFIIEVPKEGVK